MARVAVATTVAVLLMPSATAHGDAAAPLRQIAQGQADKDFWMRRAAEFERRYDRMRSYARKVERKLSTARRQLRQRAGTGIPWLDQALCIHGFESTDWRNRGHHFGGMQFALGTWYGVGGRGNPADAHPIEQLYRSFLVWSKDGGSWREWSTAGLCGQ